MKILTLIVALTMTTAASAQSVPTFKKGAPYSQVRAQLLKRGYEVTPIPATTEFDRCAPTRTSVCNAYPETRSCSGRELAPCEFVLTNRKTGAIQIMTTGLSNDPEVRIIKQMSDADISRMLAE